MVRRKETQAHSVKALVAPLPRMLSDSGRLMTDMRHHSESERAGAGLRTVGAPLIRPVPYKPQSLPRPNHRYGVLPPIQPIHLPICPSAHLMETTTIFISGAQPLSSTGCHNGSEVIFSLCV